MLDIEQRGMKESSFTQFLDGVKKIKDKYMMKNWSSVSFILFYHYQR
jgi:hypothetical protein